MSPFSAEGFFFGQRGSNALTLKAGQWSSLATTAEELLPPWHPCRRSYAQPDAGSIGGGLGSPNLLCTRSDVYVKTWAVGDCCHRLAASGNTID